MAGKPTIAEAWIGLVPTMQGGQKAIQGELESIDADGAGKKVGGRFGAALAAAAVAAGAIIAKGLWDAVGAASDLNETATKTAVVFGDATDQVNSFAKQGARQLGMSEKAALDAASTFGVFGKSAGLAGGDLAGFSTDLTTLAVDFASFYNSSPEDAVIAIGAALRGESEPIRQFGILLDDATLRNRAFSLGLISSTKDALTPQVKVLAAQAEIMAQSTDAQGDFIRTSDGLANQQRTLSGLLGDTSARLGQYLLPAASAVAAVMIDKVFPALDKYVFPALDKVSSAVGTLWTQFKNSGAAKAIGDVFASLWARVQEIDMADLSAGLKTVTDFIADLIPKVQEAATDAMPALVTVGNALGDVFGFIADHSDILIKALPYLAAAFLAVKGAQALNNIVGRDSLIGSTANTIAAYALARSNAALAASNRALMTSTVSANTAEKASLLTRGRAIVVLAAQKVATIATNVATKAAAAGQWLLNAAMTANPVGLIIAGILALAAAVIWAYNNVDWFKTGVDAIGAAFVWLWDTILFPYIEAFTTVWTWMWENVMKPVFDFIVAYVKLVGDVWSWLWTNAISPAIDGIVTGVTWLKDRWEWAFGLVRDTVSGAVDFITSTFQKALDFFEAAPGKIGGFFSGIGDTISNAFKFAFNKVAGFWNNTVGKLAFKAPDWIPSIGGKGWDVPDIPLLANGGIVTKPTLAMIGEGRGPEAVVPLEKWDAFNAKMGGSSSGGTTRLHPDDIQALGQVMLAGANVAAAKRIDNLERQLKQMSRQAVVA